MGRLQDRRAAESLRRNPVYAFFRTSSTMCRGIWAIHSPWGSLAMKSSVGAGFSSIATTSPASLRARKYHERGR